MAKSYEYLMQKVKSGTASTVDWEDISTNGLLKDLPPYYLTRCPEHLRPSYLQHEPMLQSPSPTKGLSGIPHCSDTYEEDDNDSTESGVIDADGLDGALVTAVSSSLNGDKDEDLVSRALSSEVCLYTDEDDMERTKVTHNF